MIKKKVIIFLVLIFIYASFNTAITYATLIPVTDEKLSEAFQRFVVSEMNEEHYNITLSNGVINVTVDDETYILNYDLTSSNPNFTFELPIEKGINYKEFKNNLGLLTLPTLGYIAFANVQGAEIYDAALYIFLADLKSALKDVILDENSYIIIKDSEASTNGVENQKQILESEFGDEVINYVNDRFKEKQTLKDPNGMNSYELNIERKDLTETSCKLVATLSINSDTDFSKLTGYTDEWVKSLMDPDITEENADYLINLKVGQKCIIKTNRELSYMTSGYDCVDLDAEKKEITATSKGFCNGDILDKTIYIIVEENYNNEELEPIIIYMDDPTVDEDLSSENSNGNTNENTEEENIENKEDTNNISSRLPVTGLNSGIFFISIMAVIITIITGLILKKNRDI